MGEFADEADGVGHEHALIGRQAEAARGGVERGEELIFLENLGAGQSIEERGLAGIGVSDDRGQGPLAALSALPLRRALTPHGFEVGLEPVNSLLDLASIRLELALAFAPAHADAAFLPREVGPEPGQAGKEMFELSQLDLQLAFAGPGAPGENVENHIRAIEHLAVEDALEIAGLGG